MRLLHLLLLLWLVLTTDPHHTPSDDRCARAAVAPTIQHPAAAADWLAAVAGGRRLVRVRPRAAAVAAAAGRWLLVRRVRVSDEAAGG